MYLQVWPSKPLDRVSVLEWAGMTYSPKLNRVFARILFVLLLRDLINIYIYECNCKSLFKKNRSIEKPLP